MRRLLALAAALALLIAPAAARADGASLAVSSSAVTQGRSVMLSLAGFAPKETISLWLTLPDYRVQALGDLQAGADGMATYDLAVTVGYAVGGYAVSARGDRSGMLASARLDVLAAQGAAPTPGVTLGVDRSSGPQGECFYFEGAGYAASETIAVWLRLPDGAVTNEGLVGEFAAKDTGGFRYRICFGPLAAAGEYAFTAYGKASGRTGVATFRLERGDELGASPGGAVLFADPPTARQLDTITIVGGGFDPGETISLWITLPNGVAQSLFAGRTSDGTFQVDVALPALPVGRHLISAYGQASGQRAVAELELLPGDGG